MNLFNEILIKLLSEEKIKVNFPELQFSSTEMVDIYSFKALQKIKAIIENDDLSDFECIEEIVCILEEIGSDGGSRHDF